MHWIYFQKEQLKIQKKVFQFDKFWHSFKQKQFFKENEKKLYNNYFCYNILTLAFFIVFSEVILIYFCEICLFQTWAVSSKLKCFRENIYFFSCSSLQNNWDIKLKPTEFKYLFQQEKTFELFWC